MDTVPVIESASNADAIKLWINFAASLGLTGLMAAFMIFLFGRENSLVYKLPSYKTLALKTGIAMCTAGALLNAVTFSNPSWSETLLNAGLCTLFAWAAWFHYVQFVHPVKQQQAAQKLEAAIKASKPVRKAARKATTK